MQSALAPSESGSAATRHRADRETGFATSCTAPATSCPTADTAARTTTNIGSPGRIARLIGSAHGVASATHATTVSITIAPRLTRREKNARIARYSVKGVVQCAAYDPARHELSMPLPTPPPGPPPPLKNWKVPG